MPAADTPVQDTLAERIDHREGCPADRIETFEADRPRNQTYPLGGRVRVARCVDCGRDAYRSVKED